jgi:hypothetical protein
MSVHREIEKFLRATDMPPTKFGRLAVRDPRFVLDLRLGREPGPQITARVRAFLAEQKRAQQQGHGR